ncbi:MAG: hypothetical protein H8D67_26935 [Deltaproteobacteria bacterium]|nr:hypothetical protein [Deltaproteobacteria bacterium]
MTLISKLSLEELVDLQNKIAGQIVGCTALEDAAQEYMSILYEALQESIILARFFATIPFEELPEPNKQFVMNIAHSADISELIREQTMVLSLLGTRGSKSEWNDRHGSRGHVGIPLASSDSIDKIPMMSRLLKQLGAGIEWIDANDTELVARTFKNISGVFYVRDAKTEVDNKGRKVIAAQDFVQNKNVKTVFGIGGCYLGSSLFFSTIIFTREFLERDLVERFMLQANKFKTTTLNLVNEGKIFA